MKGINFAGLLLTLLLVAPLPCALADPNSGQAGSNTDKSRPKQYRFVGNNFSKKFHKPDCEFARKISIYHVRLIETRQDALKNNFKACNWCMPKWTKSVSSKLIENKKVGSAKQDLLDCNQSCR